MPQSEDLRLARHPFRGLLFAIASIAIVLLLTAVFWCIWAFIAHRRLQAQIDAIAVLHQPFWPKEFSRPHVPDAQNAAELWKIAFAALPAIDLAPSNSNLNFKDYPPFPPSWHKMEDQSVVMNAQVFALAHRAAIATQIDWGDSERSIFAGSPFYNQARETANVLGDAILHAHMHGDDALALDRVHDLLKLADSQGETGTEIGKLVSTGIFELCCDRILGITPDLNVQSAGRERIENLISYLLDERIETRQRIESMDCNRMQLHEAMADQRKRAWSLGPMIDLSEARVLVQRRVDRLAATAASDWEAEHIYQVNPTPLMTELDEWDKQYAATKKESIEWSAVYENAYRLDRFLQAEWKGVADRRAAAIALAIALYRENQQEWPAKLGDLVPKYLPMVPGDPFHPAPIGYVIRRHELPDGSDRPMLYFDVTTDPATSPLPTEPDFGWTYTRGQHFSQWRDLSRWYTNPAPVDPGLPRSGGPMR